MILDSSVVIATFLKEPGYQQLVEKIAQAPILGIGTPTLVETGIVLSARLGRDARALLDRFVQEFGIQIIPFGESHWREAISAYLRYGKGRHPAALNYGDCLAYATAILANQPLLFVGNDFPKTDITPA
ncbi:MAG: type II toxin-antitoxin system VapC family toxin [Myxococcota bacterium]|nr:type II toxin-antitoxin system VapC family toxin [Myxococcota bacterium]